MKRNLISIALWAMLSGTVALQTGCKSTENAENSVTKVVNFEKAKVKSTFIKGADVSTLIDMGKAGFKYFDENGVQKDVLAILKEQGFDYIRVRLWNNPKDAHGNFYGAGNNDIDTDLEIAKRAKALGFKVLLDFHYSDFWADPGKQFKPKAWENLSFEELNEAIYTFTKDTIKSFKDAGLMPDMVQIGNEINGGVLWPDGKSYGGDGREFDRLASLLKSAIKGFKEAATDSDCKVMLHLAQGTKQDAFKWWFDEITSRKVDFDIIGMSMYTWQDGPISALKDNIKWVKQTYKKDVIVVEGSYPYTLRSEDRLSNDFTKADEYRAGYSATVEGQYLYLKDLLEGIDEAGGSGFFYWEAAWKTGKDITWATEAAMQYIKCGRECQTGNTRENQALFDKDGKALPSLKVFNN